MHLAPQWKWLGVRNLPCRGQRLAWLAVRAPDVRLYTNFQMPKAGSYQASSEDVTGEVVALGSAICVLALRHGTDLLVFAGSTAEEKLTTSVRVLCSLSGSYRLRRYDSLLGHWQGGGLVPAEHLRQGHVLEIEREGFSLLELAQEVRRSFFGRNVLLSHGDTASYLNSKPIWRSISLFAVGLFPG